MRDITVTKLEFDEFLFPFVTNEKASSDDEYETLLRVLRVLKDPDITEDERIPDELARQAEKVGKRLWPGKVLAVDEHVFTFAEDEYRLVRDRVRAAKKKVSALAVEDFDLLLKKVEDAPERRDLKVEKTGTDD